MSPPPEVLAHPLRDKPSSSKFWSPTHHPAQFIFPQRNLQNRTGFALRFVFVLHPIPF